jgi:hypothetical protein
MMLLDAGREYSRNSCDARLAHYFVLKRAGSMAAEVTLIRWGYGAPNNQIAVRIKSLIE